ncbi:MAG TPA: ABC transporter ATP-binding protein [archaeon]|nr:ABC transporter ATP-binding protein [archaeon]
MRPAIEITNLSKIYKVKKKDFYALKDINLSIEKGEIFGLLGPNGAGKTTLLNTLIGFLYPDKGEAKVLGVKPYSNREVLEKMNFISGETRFHWSLHSIDILNYYGMSYNIPKKERARRIESLIDFFEIDRIRNKKFAWLSTGERMRLVFAKALLNNPKVLLLDEPTLGLDPDIAMKVRKEVKRVNKKFKTTILLTSHYMNEVEILADRVAFINKGEIIDIGSVEKVKLSKFDTYDVIIQVDKVKEKKDLKDMGFSVSGNKISKKLSSDENLSQLLSDIAKLGYKVQDIETKKPTLEDYFVKIVDGQKK